MTRPSVLAREFAGCYRGCVRFLATGEMEVAVTPATRKRLSSVVRGVLSVAIVAGIFIGVLPRIADLDKVWSIMRGLTWREDVLLALVAVWNIVTYWPVVVNAMPGLSYRQAVIVNHSTTSVAMTLPAGGAIAVGLSYAMYSSWGFGKREIVRSAVVTGIMNIMVKLALPIVALALLAANGEPSDWVLGTALVGLAVLIGAITLLTLVLWRARFARLIGTGLGYVASWFRRLFGLEPYEAWGDTAVRFRGQTIELLRDRWPLLMAGDLLSQSSVYIVLLVALRVVGIPQGDVGWAQALAVFAIVRLASSFPILPGNVGLAELGYIGGLVLVGGERTAVVAAVLVFRFLTFYAQIPIGAVTYVIWRRNRRWRKQPTVEEPFAVADGSAGGTEEARDGSAALGAAASR